MNMDDSIAMLKRVIEFLEAKREGEEAQQEETTTPWDSAVEQYGKGTRRDSDLLNPTPESLQAMRKIVDIVVEEGGCHEDSPAPSADGHA